ncbi:MAG: flagellar hook-associated protein FlgK [gamma proteobacterium endosymbiont of Lamellibrachia anaximandri]|nr:flagellar hook-associated protein FlgK [gamma proteobacterium endosymbiont of Lamellibrachia anaximandri]
MSGILSIGVSALLSNQQALNTVGHNIANVNTEGYSRQQVDFATRNTGYNTTGWNGSGVQLTGIDRQYDNFLSTSVRRSQSATEELGVYYNSALRLDNLVADSALGMGPAMQDFFDAVQGLADDPSAVPARQLVLAEAESLVDRFHYIDGEIEAVRSRLNDQLDFAVDEVNRLATSIAELNVQVANASNSGLSALPNDLLDQRDHMLDELSKLVDIQVLEQRNGSMNVFIGKGQALVMDTQAATLSAQNSNGDPEQRDLAFTTAYGTQVVTDHITGGQLGGLLGFREDILDPAQNRLGLVALGIADELNSQHALGLDLDGLAGADIFSMGSVDILPNANNAGGAVTATYTNVGDLTASDYMLQYTVLNTYTLTRQSDNQTFNINTGGASPFTYAQDGFSLSIDSAGVAVGDSFQIRPTRDGADGFDLLIHDADKLAAASRLLSQPLTDANGNPANSGDAVMSQPVVSNTNGLPYGVAMQFTFVADADGAGNSGFTVANGPVGAPNDYILYDPASESTGKSFPVTAKVGQFDAFGGISFSISGTPVVGDQFTVGNNTNGKSDNRNALTMAGLQGMDTLFGGTATFGEAYSQMVSDLGAKTHHAEMNLAAQEGSLERSKAALDEVSGVNLDEEAAKLVQFQQAYQASAQVISVASSLFDTLLSAVRR